MDRKINCNILTPERVVYNGKVDFVVVPAYDGEMGFLYNHAPLISELDIGELRLLNGEEREYMVVENGFVEIRDNEMIILTENAIKREDILKEDIEQELKELKMLEKPSSHEEIMKLEILKKKLNACLKILSR